MLHLLNLIAVVVVLPTLVSSFPQSSRWKEMYERLQGGYPAPRNPLDDRSGPLRRALEGLNRLELQQTLAGGVQDNPGPLGIPYAAEAAPQPYLLPQGERRTGGGGVPSYPGRRREDILSRLLAGRSSGRDFLSGGEEASRGADSPLPYLVGSQQKRGSGFIGAPGSAGGANMFGR